MGEIKIGVTENGDRITTNTMYDRGTVVVQHLTIRRSDGTVETTNMFGRKILP